MRIQMVIARMDVGGAENVLLRLSDELVKRGHRVSVVGGQGELDADLAQLDVQRFLVRDPRRSLFGSGVAAVRTADAVRDFRPDVIHAHNARVTAIAAAAARLAAPRRPPPVLATFHGVVPAERRRAALCLRPARRVACVSQDLADALVANGVDRRRLAVVANAVDLSGPLTSKRRSAIDRELGLDGAPVVSAVGRLVPQKAHERFLEAAALVRAVQPGTRFLVIGDGPLRSTLEEKAAQFGLGRAATFTGTRRDARDIIARSEVVVFTSRWEGLSIAALEALAAAVPVVATNVHGMQELLGGGAGLLVEPSAASVASAICELLDDGARRAEMGERGRELVAQRYSPELMVERYLDLYGGLLRTTGRPYRERRSILGGKEWR
jgi:glycosyltransferase involved in cell wall biosynthesis